MSSKALHVAEMQEHIKFEQAVVTKDKVGNHANTWEPYYECHGSVTMRVAESAEAGTTRESCSITIIVRACKAVWQLGSTTHRVVYRNRIWNISGINTMKYLNRECVQIECTEEREGIHEAV